MTIISTKRVGWIGSIGLIGLVLLTAGCGVLPGSSSGTASNSSAPSTALEQLALERINRARLKPTAEATLFGIALNESVPAAEQISTAAKQALAMNATLTQTAREHSTDMQARNYFEHNTPEGVTPFDRMSAAGYLFSAAGENLAWRGDTISIDEAATVEQQHADLFVDSTIADRGHRTTMLKAIFREVGVGIIRGNFTDAGTQYDSLLQTQDYGAPLSDDTFVLGVVYTDTNSNGRYDFGEGQANVAVTLASVTKTTNAGGGYAFEVVEPGSYTLFFSPGPSTSVTISAGSPNIKVDLVNNTNIVVNLGLGAL